MMNDERVIARKTGCQYPPCWMCKEGYVVPFTLEHGPAVILNNPDQPLSYSVEKILTQKRYLTVYVCTYCRQMMRIDPRYDEVIWEHISIT
jgi:hypothetical protein